MQNMMCVLVCFMCVRSGRCERVSNPKITRTSRPGRQQILEFAAKFSHPYNSLRATGVPNVRHSFAKLLRAINPGTAFNPMGHLGSNQRFPLSRSVPEMRMRDEPLPRTTRRDAIGLAGASAGGVLLPASTPALAKVSAATREKVMLPQMGIGAFAWGDSLYWGYDSKNDDELAEVFDYAVSKGLGFFETAEVYGLGRSETLIGKFAARSPQSDSIQICTKFAALPWRTKPGDVVEAAKKQVERLGRTIDLYLIHFPNAWANEAYWDGLADAVDAGLVRAVGVSNYGVEAVRACHAKLKSRGIALHSNEIQLNLLYPYALENGLVDACKELDVDVISYCPLGQGLLTGKYALPDKLPSGPRKSIAEKYLQNPKYYELIDTMRDVGRSKLPGGASPAQVALAWCIAKGTCPIPGARTLNQVSSNLAALDVRLSKEEVARLDAAAARVEKVLTPDMNLWPSKDVFTGMTMYDS